MHARPGDVPFHATAVKPELLFRFDEALCIEVLSQLQTHLAPAGKSLRFGSVRNRHVSVYIINNGRLSKPLWLDEDYMRDWFVAKYSHDMEQKAEVEQEILFDLNAQSSGRSTG
ncbi:MAG: hypothetical protein ACYDB9_11435 [Gammaproteobacteria bacterium]